ncbi:glycerophosphodiester phosphodiesterase family protein [Chitinophaga lutea]
MKRTLFMLLCAAAPLLTLAQQTRTDSILLDFHQRPDRVLVAAHRAAHTHYPENSLAAIKETIRLGVDIAELDVQRTKDGVFVLMHDRTITRTTGKPGSVADYTLEQLQKFPLLHNGQPTKERIPTFRDALLAAKDRILIDVDFKVDGLGAAKDAAKLIRETGMTKQVLFFLYDHPDAPLLQAYDRELPIMPRVRDAAATQETLRNGKYPVLHLDDSFYTNSIADTVRAQGARVWMNALGKYDSAEKESAGAGFDQFFREFPRTGVVQTDLPGELVLYLRRKGLHR